MSTLPALRRTDREMTRVEMIDAIARGRCGRVASVGKDGWPYCVPLLYALLDGQIYVHGTAARGHFRTNIDASEKVCFEIDESGPVFAYGRFECDTTVAYQSVIVFGTIRVIDDLRTKRRFFDSLMGKYAQPSWQRPKGFYPRIDAITVYAIEIVRMSGKRLTLPLLDQQWPAKDRTMTPNAQPDELV